MTPATAAAVLFSLVLAVTGGRRARASSQPKHGAARARGRRGPTTVAYAREHLAYVERLTRDVGLWEAWQAFGFIQCPGLPPSAFYGAAASSLGGVRGNPYPPSGTWWVERATVARYLRGFLVGAFSPGVAVTEAQYRESTYLQGVAALRRLRESLEAVAAAGRRAGLDLDVDLANWSPWEFRLAVAGYSAGEGATVAVLRACRGVLGVPKGSRWDACAEELARLCEASPNGRVAGLPLRGIGGAASVLVRPQQRYEVGRLLVAPVFPADARWYVASGWPARTDAVLSSLAAGGDP